MVTEWLELGVKGSRIITMSMDFFWEMFVDESIWLGRILDGFFNKFSIIIVNTVVV